MSKDFSPHTVTSDSEGFAPVKEQPSVGASDLYQEWPLGPELEFSEWDQEEEPSKRQGGKLGPITNALLWIEPFWIALLSPLLLLPGQFVSELLHPVLIAALFLFWPVRLLIQHRITPRTPLDTLLALLLLLVPVGIWISPDKNASWIAVGYLLLGVCIYVAIVNWSVTKRHPWLVGLGLCLLGISLAIVGPQILANAPTKLFENPNLQASVNQAREQGLETVNPNILAGGLVFVLPILFALTLQTNLMGGTGDALRDRVTNIVFTIVCGALVLAVGYVLILTQSRGAYIAAALSAWLVLWLRWPRAWFLWIVLIISGIGSISWFGLDNLLGQSKFDHSINSYEGRTEIWIRTIEGLFDYPLTGIGIGTFEETALRLYPFSIYTDKSVPHAHNMLLQIGADLGVFGLAAMVGLLVAVVLMFSQTIQAYRHSRSGVNVAFAIGGIGAIVAMLTHGIFDAALWGTKLSALPWMLYGLAVVLPKTEERKTRRRRRKRSS